MGSVGFWELVGLAVLALFIFGPERLPGIARTVGKTVAQVRREANKTLTDLRDAAGLDEDIASLAKEARELSTSLRDVKKSTAAAIMGPLGDTADEVREAKALAEGKTVSNGGPRDLAMSAQGLVPGDAPFDPDAT